MEEQEGDKEREDLVDTKTIGLCSFHCLNGKRQIRTNEQTRLSL